MPDLYKLEISGIVYLVDPATTLAYTYDPVHPTEIGRVIWPNPQVSPKIELKEGWAAILEAKKLTC